MKKAKVVLMALFLFGLVVGMTSLISCVTTSTEVQDNPYANAKEVFKAKIEETFAKEDQVFMGRWQDYYPERPFELVSYGGGDVRNMSTGRPLSKKDHLLLKQWEDAVEEVKELMLTYQDRIEEHDKKVLEKIRITQNAQPKKDDVDFLLESASYFIDFSKRSDEQLETFVAKSHVILSVSSMEGAKTDRRTYDIFQNLLKHYTEAGEILYEHGKLSKDTYNDLRIAALQYDRNLKDMLYR